MGVSGVSETGYGLRRRVDLAYDEAVERVVPALKQEGFGILTTIDVKQTMKEKLGVDFDRYVILGACNPSLAHRAFQAEWEIGLLMPCNVVVYENPDGGSTVAAMDPAAGMGIVGNPDLREIASSAREKLRRALESL